MSESSSSSSSYEHRAGDIPHEWIPDEALQGIEMDRTIHADETNIDAAKRILDESLPGAVASVTHLALNSQNEKIRLDASKYIIERNMGTLNNPVSTGKGDPWTELLNNVLVDKDNTPTSSSSSSSSSK